MQSFINALNKKRAAFNENDKGFTLIELLVVVIIIGILAAIAIPIFLGQQNQAKDSAVKSDLASAKVLTVSWLVDSTTLPTAANLTTAGFLPTVGTTGFAISAITGTPGGFCLQETSATGTVFSITHARGVTAATC